MTFPELIASELCDLYSENKCFRKGKVHGIAEQVTKDNRLIPVVNNGGRGLDVLPDSRSFQIYFRVLDSTRERDAEGFGDSEYLNKMRLRIVAVGDIRTMDSCIASQQALAELLTDLIPSDFTFANWYGVQSGSVTKNTNKQDVLSEEFRGNEYQSHVLDMVAVSLDVEFEGVDCDVVCTPDECEPQTIQVLWNSEEHGNIIYNTEQNCAWIPIAVPEFVNLPIRICSVTYNSTDIVIGNNPNDCDVDLSAVLTTIESTNGSYIPCILCEPPAPSVNLINPSSAIGANFANGGHTGAITTCQGTLTDYGATPYVWFRLSWDCEECFFADGINPGFASGQIQITITYKLC